MAVLRPKPKHRLSLRCRWGFHKEKILGSEGRIHIVRCERCGARYENNYYPDGERID